MKATCSRNRYKLPAEIQGSAERSLKTTTPRYPSARKWQSVYKLITINCFIVSHTWYWRSLKESTPTCFTVSETGEDTVFPQSYFLKKINFVEINCTGELCISSPSYNSTCIKPAWFWNYYYRILFPNVFVYCSSTYKFPTVNLVACMYHRLYGLTALPKSDNPLLTSDIPQS